MGEFVSSALLWSTALICALLCINGFITKVLDKQYDRVILFAIGFFIIISGILAGRSNFLALHMFYDNTECYSGGFSDFTRTLISFGIYLCTISMLKEAGLRYILATTGFIAFVAISALISYPYL